MSTCPACHQPIPKSCDTCGEQIIFREGKPVSWQNHFKTGCGRNGRVRAPAVDPELMEALTVNFGKDRALLMAPTLRGKTVEEKMEDALSRKWGNGTPANN